MQTIRFETIDSTSSEAARLLEKGEVMPPFCVVAAEQSGGRGRRGRQWSSPPGNIYLTLVWQTAAFLPQELGKVPLVTAVLLAEWIQQALGLRITLKWPNDLLFGGKKIGGILCESVQSDKDVTAFMVGIGLNVLMCPEINDENIACSFADILGADHLPPAHQLAQDLINFFEERWNLAAMDETLAKFSDYGLEAGQVWASLGEAKEPLMQIARINPNGSLVLHEVGQERNEKQLFSVNHEYGWLYQGTGALKHPILVADLGNSRFKVALFKSAALDEEPLHLFCGEYLAKEWQGLAVMREWLAALGIEGSWPVFVGSVNAKWETLFLHRLSELGLSGVMVKKRAVRTVACGYDLSQIGIDRLALIEAALDHLCRKSSSALIAISSGTALTVDLVDEARQHRGGVILAGLAMRLNALAAGTTLLPQIAADEVWHMMGERKEDLPGSCLIRDPLLGHNTREALAIGTVLEVTAVVEYLAASIKQTLGPSPSSFKVVVTGGGGRELAVHLKADYMEHAVLSGLRIMALGGRSS
jgi:biotin-[acetyl-CoA-carboxylase] ligase BirA-like protein